MKKTADDYVEKANLRVTQDNRLSKKESGYRRNKTKKTKPETMEPTSKQERGDEGAEKDHVNGESEKAEECIREDQEVLFTWRG